MKRYLFVIAFILIVGLASWPYIQIELIGWRLQRNCQKCIGHSLTFKRAFISSDRRLLTLENPELDLGEGISIKGTRADINFQKPIPWFGSPSSFDLTFQEGKFLIPGFEEFPCCLKAQFNQKRKMFFSINFSHSENLDLMITQSKKKVLFEVKADSVSLLHLVPFISLYCPAIKEFIVTNGFAEGYLACLFSKEKIEDITGDLSISELKALCHDVDLDAKKILFSFGLDKKSVENIQGYDFQIFFPKDEVTAFIPKSSFQFTEGTDFGDGILKVSDAYMDFLGKSHLISDINLCLEMNSHSFLPKSNGTFLFDQLKGEIDFTGPTSEPLASIHLEGKVNEIKTCIPYEYKENFSRTFDEDFLDLSARAHLKEGNCFLEGSLIVSKKEEFCFNGLFATSFIPEIFHFYSNKISLARYLYPFLPSEKKIDLSSQATVNGCYKDKSVTLKSDDLSLAAENKSFKIDLETSQANATVDFIQNDYVLDLEVSEGSYLEKNREILFTPLKGHLKLDSNSLMATHLESYCNGIYFSGDLDIDLRNLEKGQIEIDIRNHTFNGKVREAQDLVSKLSLDNFLTSLPIDGNLYCSKEGSYYHFSIEPKNCHIHALIRGELSEGYFLANRNDLGVHDLSLSFNYDHQGSTLDFSNIEGTLLVGSPSYFDEFCISSDGIRFSNFQQNLAQFDIWVGDRTRDILRLAGNSIGIKGKDILISFDPKLSHFGAAQVKEASIALENWMKIKSFHLVSDFSLGKVFNDLQKICKTEVTVPSGLASTLRGIKIASGDCYLKLGYNHSVDALDFSLGINQLQLDRSFINSFLLAGVKIGKKISIEQCQIEDLSFSTDFHRTGDKLSIDFLGLSYGHLFLSGFEGQYDLNKNQLEMYLDLMEVDLSYLKDLKILHKFASYYDPKGLLKLQGKIQIDFFSGESKPKILGLFDTSCYQLEVKGFRFEDFRHVICEFDSEEGFCIHSFETTFGKNKIPLSIHKIKYSFLNDAFNINGLCGGATFNFTDYKEKDTSDLVCFEGELDFDPTSSSNVFLDKSWRVFLNNLPLGSHLKLKGLWYWSRNNCWDSFRGSFQGETKGDLALSFLGEIKAIPDVVSVSNFVMKDNSGKCVVNSIDFSKDGKKWVCKIPSLRANEIKLRSNSFTLKNFKITDLEGNIEDLRSFTGVGEFRFINCLKSSKLSHLLSINTLEKMGLNESLLYPGSGFVQFEIQKGKIAFTKFKDVFSEDHSIKFYLTKGVPSTLDFNGEINLEVGLQPYNMLIKFPEIANVKINGTVKNPIFSIVNIQ